MTHEFGDKHKFTLVNHTLAIYETRSLAAAIESDWQRYEPDVHPLEARLHVNDLVTDVLADWSADTTKLAHYPPLNTPEQYVSISKKEAALNLKRGILKGTIFAAVFLGHRGLPYKVTQVERVPDHHLNAFGGPLVFILFPHLPVVEYRIANVERALVHVAALDYQLATKKVQRGRIPPPQRGEYVKAYRPLPLQLPSYAYGSSPIRRAKHALD